MIFGCFQFELLQMIWLWTSFTYVWVYICNYFESMHIYEWDWWFIKCVCDRIYYLLPVFYTSGKNYTHTSGCTACLKILDIDYSFLSKKYSHSDGYLVTFYCVLNLYHIGCNLGICFCKSRLFKSVILEMVLCIFFAYRSSSYILDKS